MHVEGNCSGGLLASKLLEGLALGLGDQESSSDTEKHEESVDLHDVVEPARGVGFALLACAQGADGNLGDDGADLSGTGRDTVRRRAITSGEALARHDKGRGVWTKVEEELRDNIQAEEGAATELVVGEADDAEDDGEDEEASKLDGFAADGIHGRDRHPIAGDGTGTDEDDVAHCSAVENLVEIRSTGVTNGGEDDGVVKAQTVESNV